eukprot:3800235-Rhodomonas_salina.1
MAKKSERERGHEQEAGARRRVECRKGDTWLKTRARKSKFHMLVTRPTFQAPIGWLNARQSSSMDCMTVTWAQQRMERFEGSG